jgi:hypothetical protein
MFDHKLPHELVNCVYDFYNPYKYIYTNIIKKLKYKYIYSHCMKELNNYNVRNRNKEILYFQKYAILTSIDDE